MFYKENSLHIFHVKLLFKCHMVYVWELHKGVRQENIAQLLLRHIPSSVIFYMHEFEQYFNWCIIVSAQH